MSSNIELSHEEIMALSGQQKPKTFGFPQLKVNREQVDENEKVLPYGAYMVTTEAGTVYCKNPLFRTFVQRFQYREYNPAENKTTARSVIVPTMFESAPDTKGTSKCGKIPRKKLEGASEAIVASQKNIQTFRLLYGLVTFPDVLGEDNELLIKDMPILWATRGRAFEFINPVIEEFDKRKWLYPSRQLHLSTTKQKKGAVTYFTPSIEIDSKEIIPAVSKEDMQYYTIFNNLIKEENDWIAEQHRKSLEKAKTIVAEAAAIQSLADDFMNDDLDDLGLRVNK